MKALEARALLFRRKITMLNVDFPIPDVPELTGQLAVLELSPLDLSQCRKMVMTANGETDQLLAMAASVCKGLVMRDSKERVCSDTDVEGIAAWGLSVVNPLSGLIDQASGLNPTAVEDAKKNSSTTQTKDSPSSSPKSSEEG